MIALPLLVALAGVTADVPVYVSAQLSPESLETALEEVDAIFAPGDVRLRWQLAPPGGVDAPEVLVIIQETPPDRRVHGCRHNLHDHRLGHTDLGARRVTLWSRQVARAASGDWDREDLPRVEPGVFARALGRVLAHELGHLFLSLHGHREKGLMRKSFSYRSLVAPTSRAFRLTERDLGIMRDTLTRLVETRGLRRADASPR